MGQSTGIQWCDDTVNPTTGCDGCELFVRGKGGPCYAGNFHERRLAKSLPKLYDASFTNVRLAPGRMAKAARWPDLAGKPRPDKPWLDGMPRMIFVSDMADALSQDIPFLYLYDEVIRAVSSDAGRRHAWLWLTKLPRRMAEFAAWLPEAMGIAWPENLWAGTSITSDKVIRRIDHLASVPARVRFLSVEPMWGPVDVAHRLGDPIHWVICGGESLQNGFAVHPFDLAWARSLRDQCRAAGVPFFLKQMGSRPFGNFGEPCPPVGRRPMPLAQRRELMACSFIKFSDSHGGDWGEFPKDLRVREVPKVQTGS